MSVAMKKKVVYPYSLTTVVEVVNYENWEKTYAIRRFFDYEAENDEEAIYTAADFFRECLSAGAEALLNIDPRYYCVSAVLNAKLVDGQGGNIITKWVKEDFDTFGAVNYGSIETADVDEENKQLRQAYWQHMMESWQGIMSSYCNDSKEWSKHMRS